MKSNMITALFSAAVLLCGCQTIDGAKWVIKDKGLYNGVDGYTPPIDDDKKKLMPEYDFARLYARSAQSPDDTGAAKAMMQSAFVLIDGNCEEYFQSNGTTQKWIFVGRDTVGAVGTLATGVMGALGAGTTSIAWVGLATATTYSGLDIFSKHFLFGADNIDAVHTLVSRQLLAEQDSATAAMKAQGFDFYRARREILSNQNVCSDARILTLVRSAIKDGSVTESDELRKLRDDSLQRANDDFYQSSAAEIGIILNTDSHSSATSDQVEGLIWLYRLAPQTADEYRAIQKLLGSTVLVTSDGAPQPTAVAQKSNFDAALQKLLSTSTGQHLLEKATTDRLAAIDAAKAKADADKAAAQAAADQAKADQDKADADRAAAQAASDQAKAASDKAAADQEAAKKASESQAAAEDAAKSAAIAKDAAEQALKDKAAAESAAKAAEEKNNLK